MGKKIKKLLSIMLVALLLVGLNLGSFAQGDNTSDKLYKFDNNQVIDNINDELKVLANQYPELVPIKEKIIDLLQNDYSFEEIENLISEDEYSKVLSIYKEVDKVQATSDSILHENVKIILEENGLNESYIKDIENKANYYREYYEIHGELPAEAELPTLEDTDKNRMVTLSSTYDPALMQLGYSVTAGQLSSQLAILGAAIGVAFPYIALIAILAGTTLVVGNIIYDYVSNYSAVDSNVKTWYSNAETVNKVSFASSTTRDLIYVRTLLGLKHYVATLSDFANLGGIIVGPAIPAPAAYAHLQVSELYSPVASDAFTAAVAAGGGMPISDNAHTSMGQILNKPHYHPRDLSGNKINTHSFYGF